MSLEDIKEWRDFYKSDIGARIANASRQYNSPDIQAYVQSQVKELAMMYLQGENPSRTQHTQSVAYEEAFDRVVKFSDLSTVLENFLKSMGANLSSNDKRSYDKCIKNIRKDIITIYGEIYARYLSIEDTKALADFWESSLGQKVKKVDIECSENALEMGEIIVKEFQTWIKKATSSRTDQKNNQENNQKNQNNGHKAVDLGLSVNWATCNLGATSPEEYGNHYAWGETTTKDTYSLETYTYYDTTTEKFTKYCMDEEQGIADHKSTLDQTDDAARVLWGETWRMPTTEEISELKDNCEWTWTVLNGVNGYKVTGPNGNHIFLPAAGWCNEMGRKLEAGEEGRYWSSSVRRGRIERAHGITFASQYSGTSGTNRSCGLSIRPVTN